MSHPTSATPLITPSSLSPTVATVRLASVAHNLRELRRILPPSTKILAVVKADGYGHGSRVMADTLSKLGIQQFGVASVQEGIVLREAGVLGQILVMGGIFSWQLKDLIAFNLIPTLSNDDVAHVLSQTVPHDRRPYPIHLEVDTGMRRLGFSVEEALALLQSPKMTQTLSCQGLMTHLADADNPDPACTRGQLSHLETAVLRLRSAGVPIPCVHAANTAGILWHPQAWLDMVRPGLMLYGYTPVPKREAPISLQPVMTLTTKVVHVKTVEKGEPVSYGGTHRTRRRSQLAVVPIGYAHGYARQLSNKGEVIIHDQRCPIVGRICMDMTIIDVTDAPRVKPGDDVIVMGKSKQQAVTAYDLATWQESIPYEVLCHLGPHVHRVYEPLANTCDE